MGLKREFSYLKYPPLAYTLPQENCLNQMPPQKKSYKQIVSPLFRYAEGTISGSNARCVALLKAMKRVISDYITPPQKGPYKHMTSTYWDLVYSREGSGS